MRLLKGTLLPGSLSHFPHLSEVPGSRGGGGRLPMPPLAHGQPQIQMGYRELGATVEGKDRRGYLGECPAPILRTTIVGVELTDTSLVIAERTQVLQPENLGSSPG